MHLAFERSGVVGGVCLRQLSNTVVDEPVLGCVPAPRSWGGGAKPSRVAAMRALWSKDSMERAELDSLRSIDRAHHLHPFTDHADMYREGTHVVVAGEGCYVVDETGRRFLDGLAGLWCVNVGY